MKSRPAVTKNLARAACSCDPLLENLIDISPRCGGSIPRVIISVRSISASRAPWSTPHVLG